MRKQNFWLATAAYEPVLLAAMYCIVNENDFVIDSYLDLIGGKL
jgi:hypothetical protein